jgi:peptide/nickel transport system substrate-binding protein
MKKYTLKAMFRNGLAALVLGAGLAATSGATAAAKDTIVIDLVNEPASLDPHGQWNPDSYYVYRNIFDNLLTRDDQGAIAPSIATEWKYLSDTEVEFTIREGVKFHDGQPLTPEDVAYSVKRIIDPAFASPQLGQFNQITDAVVTGEHTVKLTTAGPAPVLLAQLVKLSIVPKHYVEEVGKDAFNLQPIGSGPYRFVAWNRGVEVTLERNDDYWGEPGGFKTAIFHPVPDAATRLANLEAGASDIATVLDSDQAAQLQTSATARPLSVLSERVAYLALNPTKPPLDDIRVRQAIAEAIDKEGIIEGILGGYDEPLTEMVTPIHAGFVEGIETLPYDPEGAAALIAEVGPAAQAPIDLATAPLYDQRVVQAIQQMLVGIGLDVRITMTDSATLIQSIQAGPEKMPLLNFARWSCACQDADGVLFPLLHSSSGWSATRDPAVDAALEAARVSLDPAERAAQYKIVHEYVAEQIPYVPLYRVSLIYGAANGIVWTPTPDQNIYLNRVHWQD